MMIPSTMPVKISSEVYCDMYIPSIKKKIWVRHSFASSIVFYLSNFLSFIYLNMKIFHVLHIFREGRSQ